ncbi:hypothetical protein [Kutzneria buriramensis]|uniref:hypothetical protein n=1 Tax=Kutzneria buriramensis TaxID=1045776 RepID=UPI0014772717|nr:hypothetical protein [Kutzneria buriramensis]
MDSELAAPVVGRRICRNPATTEATGFVDRLAEALDADLTDESRSEPAQSPRRP